MTSRATSYGWHGLTAGWLMPPALVCRGEAAISTTIPPAGNSRTDAAPSNGSSARTRHWRRGWRLIGPMGECRGKMDDGPVHPVLRTIIATPANRRWRDQKVGSRS